jgi:hypothetical protein
MKARVMMMLAAMPLTGMAGELKAVTDAEKGKVEVTLDGKPFMGLIFRGHAKPVVYPVIGPGEVAMTRRWPLEAAAAGEEQDHPHHKSIWFNHGDVNGVDFWKEGADAGRIVVTKVPAVEMSGAAEESRVTIRTEEEWLKPDSARVCTSATVITCGTEGTSRFIDYAVTIKASEGEVTLGDTKEGTMGLRSHPALNLKGAVAKGQCVNSEGETGGAIWGRHAKWVDYWGPVDGKVLGIACFDHPGNLRHPTTWHARDYGLIAANPFGLHDFEKAPKGAGKHVVKRGESLTLRYRWLFHEGDAKSADVARSWAKWAAVRE